jgi:hypothetical protein
MAGTHNLMPLDELQAKLEPMTPDELRALAAHAGIHYNTVRWIRTGATGNPSYRVVEGLCDAIAAGAHRQ